jgi:hypothetical protein
MHMLNLTSTLPLPGRHGSSTVSGFDLKQDLQGRWVVRGAGDHWGGVFLTRDAAVKFARAELEQADCQSRAPGVERAA